MQSRMRIAYCMINCNRRDGSARAIVEVAERMALRHEVHLFARTVEDTDLTNLRWHRMRGASWPDFVDFTTYHYLADFKIRGSAFDIIHSCGNNARAANVITIQNIQPAKRAFMDRALSHERTSLPRKIAKWLYLEITTHVEKRVYLPRVGRLPPTFLPVSEGVKRELLEYYAVGSAPVEIIPNAADTAHFRVFTPEEKTAWRMSNGIPADRPVMVFAGGEWWRKGLDLCIQALTRMEHDNATLLVAGADADQPAFEQMAREAGVSKRIHFLGFRRDVAAALAAADLFLFPSWYEAFSLASIEAAACGLPIFASKINGTEDFVDPGRTGEFLEHDPAHIAAVLDNVLSDPKHLAEMGRAARSLVEANYTWDRITARTEQAYRQRLEFEQEAGASNHD